MFSIAMYLEDFVHWPDALQANRLDTTIHHP